jgi:hypothetical protein
MSVYKSTRVSISTLHAAESAHNVRERAQNAHYAKCSTTGFAWLPLPPRRCALSLSLSLPTARALPRLLDSGAARAIPAAWRTWLSFAAIKATACYYAVAVPSPWQVNCAPASQVSSSNEFSTGREGQVSLAHTLRPWTLRTSPLAAMLNKFRWVSSHPALFTDCCVYSCKLHHRLFQFTALERVFLFVSLIFLQLENLTRPRVLSLFSKERRLVPTILNRWQDADC